MDISVVIPLYNEAESLSELHAWISKVMKEHHYSYEIIFINDGSTDNSWDIIESLRLKDSHVKGIKFRRNYGKSPALFAVSKLLKAMLLLQWMRLARLSRRDSSLIRYDSKRRQRPRQWI